MSIDAPALPSGGLEQLVSWMVQSNERRLRDIETKIDEVVALAQRMISLEREHTGSVSVQQSHADKIGKLETGQASQQAAMNTLRWVCGVLVIPIALLLFQEFVHERGSQPDPRYMQQQVPYYPHPQSQFFPDPYAYPQGQSFTVQPRSEIRGYYPTP